MFSQILKSSPLFKVLVISIALASGCADGKIVTYLPDPFLASKPRPQVLSPVVPRTLVFKLISPSPSYNREGLPFDIIPPGGIKDRWKYIIIHHSATRTGSAASFHRSHLANGWDGLGYHFVIGNGTGTPDGFIEVGPRWRDQKHGAHCKTPDNRYNDHGIGICLVGDFERGGRPTHAQLMSLRGLVLFLADQARIPYFKINGHGSITHKTACPGRSFPLTAFKRSLTNLAVR